MKLNAYVVYDRAAEAFSQPMFVINEAVMLRILKNCLQNPEHNYAMNPDDFTLYLMGEFDDNTGVITGELRKVTALNALITKQNLEVVS